jgi:hypothetical protein
LFELICVTCASVDMAVIMAHAVISTLFFIIIF